MLKKNTAIKIIGLFLIIAMLAVAGCGGQGNEEGDNGNGSEQPPAKTKAFGLGTASIGGAYYAIGQGMATLVNNHAEGIEMSSEVTGGSIENPILIDNGEMEFGITNANLAYFAYEGTDPYEKKLDVTALGNLHPSVFVVATLTDSPINSIADLKAKRVAVGPAGGGTLNVLHDILAFFDLTLDDINASYLSYEDAFSQLTDGNIDCSMALGGYPSAAIVEASTIRDIKLIPIEDDIFTKIFNDYPYYSKVTVPKDVYNLEKDAEVLGLANVFFCKADMDEEDVYKIAKAVYDNLDELEEIFDGAKQINRSTLEDTPMPLHPGAKRYFDEK